MPKFILSYFSPIDKIGEGLAKAVYLIVPGSHGIVHKCLNRKTGHLVAIKRIKLNWSDPDSYSTALSEIAFLKELKHSNIVTLEQLFLDCGDIYLIYEYLSLDLRRYMDFNYKDTGLPPDAVKALRYCHARLIIHRDLKPQNVMVDVNRQIVKLTDFELAKTFGYPRRELTSKIVTLWYRAPEILLGDALYGCSVDMWSMGCIFAEMVTGTPLFRGDSGIDQLFHIFRIMGVPTEENWPDITMLRNYSPNSFPSWYANRLYSEDKIMHALDAKGFDLLTMLLRYHPLSRINAHRALSHPYFDNLDKDSLSTVSEEFAGLPNGEIPPALAKVLEALSSIANSELVVKKEEEGLKNEKKEGTLDKTSRMLPSAVIRGSSEDRISITREWLQRTLKDVEIAEARAELRH